MADLAEDRKQIFQGAGLIAFGIGFELIFSFIAKVGVARYLGSTDFGFFSIGFALVSVMTIIGLMGLPEGIARDLSRSDSNQKEVEIIVTGLIVSLGAVIILSSLIFLLAAPVISLTPHSQDLVRVVQIASLGIPLLVICRLAVGVGRGYKKAKIKVFIQHFLRPGAFFVAMTVVVVLGIQNITATYIIPVSYLPGAIFGLYYLFNQLNSFTFLKSFTFRYELLVFSAPLMISGFMRQILNHLDTFILASFEPAAQIGIYNAVYPLSRLGNVFLAAFGFIVMPILSSINDEDEGEKFESIYRFTTKWVIVGATPLILIFLLMPGELITVIYGTEYILGQNALVILMLGMFLNIILGPNANALISLGESKSIFRVTIFAAAINIVLNLVLIPPFGIEGAAVATSLATIAMTFLFSLELYKLEGIIPLSRLVVLLIISATAVGLIISIGLAWINMSPIWTLVAFGLFFGPTYLSLVFATGTLTRADVSELLSLVYSDS